MTGCKTEEKNAMIEKEFPMFEIIPDSVSKITFRNDLRETEFMNGIFYEYFYNGSGLAVGDFNNDGWEDLYFVSTLGKNKLYLNRKNMEFLDVTAISGADSGKGFDSGVTVVDINQDGLLDIYVCRTGRFKDEAPRRNALMVNMGIKDGVPVFKEMAAEYGLDDPSFSTQAGFFDYDKDGDLDMFLINHGIDTYPESKIELFSKTPSTYRGERLFRNDNGTFNDVTKEANIINNMLGYGLGLAFGDLNNDGWPDIYVSHDFSGQDHMYINQQDGTFKETAKSSTGHISNFSMGNDIADYNNDGLLDVITVDMMAEDNYGIKTSMSGMNPARFYHHVNTGLHFQYMYNTLQLNNGTFSKDGHLKFSEVAHMGNIASSDWSWSPLFFDIDNDGYKDLFISNGIKRDFRNNDFNIYRKQKEEMLKAGNVEARRNFVGDLLSKMPHRKKKNNFYINQKDLTFSKISIPQPITSSTGAAYVDLDHDGDLDIVVNNVDDLAFVYRNTSENGNDYLKFDFEGNQGNINGIGARVTVYNNGYTQIQEKYATRGFQSGFSSSLHFGVGNAKMVDSVQVLWNDGKTQTFDQVNAGKKITFRHVDAQNSSGGNLQEHHHRFTDITEALGLNVKHEENPFNDFEREELLPHRMSTLGPALAVADVNGDGLDDFYLGGAAGSSGQLYVQRINGGFDQIDNSAFSADKEHEDAGALFVDIDQDLDLDLYVSSGGNEFDEGSDLLRDRLYINQGDGHFIKNDDALPFMRNSTSCIASADFDNDGDLDLFIGGRQQAGSYPRPGKSHVLRNDSGQGEISFTEVTQSLNPDLLQLGMVTDASWQDLNGDNIQDLIVVGEWMAPTVFLNRAEGFEKLTDYSEEVGWWNSITPMDTDADGTPEFVLGNLGLNYKYKASKEEPFEVFAKDFDNNGTNDIVLGYYNSGELFPLRGRECSSNQMPFIKNKFKTYHDFGAASLENVYGKDALENALHYQASNFASSILRLGQTDQPPLMALPSAAQISSINDAVVYDFNGDGYQDLVAVGNLYGAEIETPRNDAGYGFYFKGGASGELNMVPAHISGLFVEGDSKVVKLLKTSSGMALLIGKNDGYLQLIKVE